MVEKTKTVEVKLWKLPDEWKVYPGSTYSTSTLATNSTLNIAPISKKRPVVDVSDIVAIFLDAEEADEELMKAREAKEKEVLKCEKADQFLSRERDRKERMKRIELRNRLKRRPSFREWFSSFKFFQ
jgi:hypothetical protein